MKHFIGYSIPKKKDCIISNLKIQCLGFCLRMQKIFVLFKNIFKNKKKRIFQERAKVKIY